MRQLLLVAGFTVLLPIAGHAWNDLENMQMATALGSVIGSEKPCGLSYDQDAIKAFIDENIPANDMQFSPTLSLMTEGVAYNVRNMSQSAKTAHCRQIERTARHYGFITSD